MAGPDSKPLAGRVLASGTPQQVSDDPEVQRAYLGVERDEDQAVSHAV